MFIATKIFLVVFAFAIVAEAKHIHPRGNIALEPEDALSTDKLDTDDNIPLINIKSLNVGRYVPINSDLFFKLASPCPEGYQRDAFAICREVW